MAVPAKGGILPFVERTVAAINEHRPCVLQHVSISPIAIEMRVLMLDPRRARGHLYGRAEAVRLTVPRILAERFYDLRQTTCR